VNIVENNNILLKAEFMDFQKFSLLNVSAEVELIFDLLNPMSRSDLDLLIDKLKLSIVYK
jgi:hypothetical protein